MEVNTSRILPRIDAKLLKIFGLTIASFGFVLIIFAILSWIAAQKFNIFLLLFIGFYTLIHGIGTILIVNHYQRYGNTFFSAGAGGFFFILAIIVLEDAFLFWSNFLIGCFFIIMSMVEYVTDIKRKRQF